VGFSAAHLLPTWGAFSDSFIDAAPAAGVTWFSWVTAILEILADLLFVGAGIAVLVARSTPTGGAARHNPAGAKAARSA
jgi:hypothetical protein